MRLIKPSLNKLVVSVIFLNIPLLAYLFFNVHVVNQVYFDPHRNPLGSMNRYNSTGDIQNQPKVVTKPPQGTSMFKHLIDRWQPIDSTENAHYVFSAFLYKIGSARTIRIIGAACQKSITSKIYCQLLYGSNHGNESVVTVSGSVKQLPEGSDFKYRGAFFHCRLPDKRVPRTVAITTRPNMTPLNQLLVRSQEANQSKRKNFAICVSPFFGGYNSTTDLIQWIEMNRILGADLFVFYNFSTGKNVDKVLEFYSRINLVQVVPWDVSKFRPPGKKQELNYVGQTIALNDCLMRVKPISEFVVNIDMDELIVPHGGLSTWWDIVNKYPNTSVYNFKSSFFRLNWNNTKKDFPRKDVAEKFKITFLLKLDREVKIFPPSDRTKYFAKTDVANTLGVHKVIDMTLPHKSEMFPLGVGLVHHYRIIYATINGISQPDYINNGPKVFDDTVLRKYGDTLIDNVLKVHTELHG